MTGYTGKEMANDLVIPDQMSKETDYTGKERID